MSTSVLPASCLAISILGQEKWRALFEEQQEGEQLTLGKWWGSTGISEGYG
jgi:hypothetical protein